MTIKALKRELNKRKKQHERKERLYKSAMFDYNIRHPKKNGVELTCFR